MTPRQHRALTFALTAALIAVGLALMASLIDQWTGSRITSALGSDPNRRDFALTDMNGQPATLNTFAGKWVLMFFGYTSCPDVCPTTLLNMTNTLAAMGPRAKDVQPVFVTIDPERDTPATLKAYLANFEGGIIGLTGSAAEIAKVAQKYGVYFERGPATDGGYLMNHSTAVILISPGGAFRRVYRPDDDPRDFAATLSSDMQSFAEQTP